MQIMKQGVRAPLSVARQVAIIYAGVNGWLDEVPVRQVVHYEQRLTEALETTGIDFVHLFNERKTMDNEVKAALCRVLDGLKERVT